MNALNVSFVSLVRVFLSVSWINELRGPLRDDRRAGTIEQRAVVTGSKIKSSRLCEGKKMSERQAGVKKTMSNEKTRDRERCKSASFEVDDRLPRQL